MTNSIVPTFFEVFVPRDGHLEHIAPGSGIVGLYNPERDDYLLHYEGNQYGAGNIKTFADRCLHAAGRLRQHYPTTAQCRAFPSQVAFIGQYRPIEHRVVIVDARRGHSLLAQWLGATTLGEHELVATS